MILIEVPANPNCAGCEQTAFNEMDGDIRTLSRIVVSTLSGDALCEAASVGSDGSFGPARVRLINDSGEGPSYLIFGGEWGVRFRRADSSSPWDLSDRSQWGEPFKVYGISPDVIF
jgi:hypothetical protein